jgi:small subunit ribosomal protein S16
MLVIRLQRTGRTNLATYRIVVAEKARAVKGKFHEIIGHYLPAQKEAAFVFKADRLEEWLGKGAIPSDTMARLFKKAGVKNMEKFIVRYAKQKTKNPSEEPAAPAPVAAAAAPAPEAPAAEAPAAEAPAAA